MPVGEHRVDERTTHIDAASARLEHPLGQLLHERGREHQVGQLVAPVAGHEDPVGRVDPDLLDRRVVEERLQRAEAAHPAHQLAHHRARVGEGSDESGQAALVVVAHDLLRDTAYDGRVALGVHTVTAHQRAHRSVEALDQCFVGIRSGPGGRVGVGSSHVPAPRPEWRFCPGH
jgi:hypothetical protein